MKYNKAGINIPPVDSPFFQEWLASKKDIPDNWRAWATELHDKGYAVLKNAIDLTLIDKTIDSIKDKFGSVAGEEPTRQLDLWSSNENVKKVALQQDILDFLAFIYERKPLPFQTLNFKFGTQQCLHSDLIHFSCIPRRYMCGIWVAMEDLDAENGPLQYCEGSHKLREYNYTDLNIPFGKRDYEYYPLYEDFLKELVKAKGMQVSELHIKKGDVMIWSANLLHGGKEITGKGRTRWSQVTHVYFDDCIYYTPMWSDENSGKLYVRHSMTNIADGKKIVNKIRGKEVGLLRGDDERYWVIGDGFRPSIFNMLKQLIKK
jgi:ectoine hydroxylase-related dioxygenase (phytanoyl-CoA dioxygenase family)